MDGKFRLMSQLSRTDWAISVVNIFSSIFYCADSEWNRGYTEKYHVQDMESNRQSIDAEERRLDEWNY